MSSQTRPQIELRTGYFGKLPTHGDFVSNGFSRSMINTLDEWLRQCVRESQRALGRDWLDTFLVAPAWRGLIGAGVLGPEAVMLVMIPSVDRVGRYFPLVIAAPMPGHTGPVDDLISKMSGWFRWAEARAQSVLEPKFSRAELDHELSSVQFLFAPPAQDVSDEVGDAESLWWVHDEERAILRFKGLPDPSRFHDQILCHTSSNQRRPVQPPVVGHRMLLKAECGGATVRGARKATLTDAFAIGPDGQALGLISGIGHVPGLTNAVEDAAETLGMIENHFSMNDLVAEAKGKLGTINTKLRARGMPTGRVFGASVAVLLIQGGRYALFWSGNVRAYLLREGQFIQLTRDHVDPLVPNLITRALGVEMRPNLESTAGRAKESDRFLLCSGGVHAALAEAEIAQVLENATSAQQAADHLTQDALIAGTALDAAALIAFLTPREP